MKANNTITFLINSLSVGGSEKVCVMLCNELSKRGCIINLIVVNQHTPLEKMLSDKINLIKLEFNKIYKSIFKVMSLCGEIKTDSLIVFDPELFVIAQTSRIVNRKKYKLIFRCYNTLSKSFEFYSSKRHSYLNKPIIKFYLRNAKNIIAQSKGMKIDLIKNFNIRSENITVIPNPALLLNDDNMEFKKENIILFVGRIAPQKGIPYLIQSFEKFVKLFPDYKLLIVGEGIKQYEKKIKDLVLKKRLNNRIFFEGRKKDIAHYYKRSKVTALTSLFEGFPNVLVESISLGTPVVSFNCESGVSDIIKNGTNGYIVPMFDTDQFAVSLNKLVTNPLDLNKVIESSKKFSIDKIINSYQEIL